MDGRRPLRPVTLTAASGEPDPPGVKQIAGVTAESPTQLAERLQRRVLAADLQAIQRRLTDP